MPRYPSLALLRGLLLVLLVLPQCLKGIANEEEKKGSSILLMSALRLGGYHDNKPEPVPSALPTTPGSPSNRRRWLKSLKNESEVQARRLLQSVAILQKRAQHGWDWVLHVPSHPVWSKPCPGAPASETRPCVTTLLDALKAQVEAIKAVITRWSQTPLHFRPHAQALAERWNRYMALTKTALHRAAAKMLEGLSQLARMILAMARTVLTASPLILDTTGMEGLPTQVMVESVPRGMTPGLSSKGSTAAWRALEDINGGGNGETVTRRTSLLSRDRTFRVVYVISRGKKRRVRDTTNVTEPREMGSSLKGGLPVASFKTVGPISLKEKVSLLDDWKRQHAQEVESGLRKRDGEVLTHAFSFLQRLVGQYPDAEDVEMTIEETASTSTKWEDNILLCTFLSGAVVAAVIVVLGWRLECLRLAPPLEGENDYHDEVTASTNSKSTSIPGSMTSITTKCPEGEDEDGFHILQPGDQRFVQEEDVLLSDDDDLEFIDPSASMMAEDGVSAGMR